MPLPATIHTAVGQSMIGRVTRLFNNSVEDVLTELLQNARRADVARIDIDSFDLADRQILVIRDDGSGIDDPAKLVTLGDSGWGSEIAHREDPAGMGVFSLAGHRVEIRSFSKAAGQGWCVVIAPDAWESGIPLEIEPCSIAVGTEILIDMPEAWVKALPAAVIKAPKRFSAALGVQVASLAGLAGVHRNTLRNPASERLQDMLREMVKVISAAATLTGDITKAIYWYRNEPIADYDHKTAAELVADGHVDAVMTHLRDLENGASG